jgi:hypothetical protein
MSIDTIKVQAQSILQSKFPGFIVRLEHIEDDDAIIGIGVFRVPEKMVGLVENTVNELEETLCRGANVSLVAMVRDEETTAKYYSHLLCGGTFQSLVLSDANLKSINVNIDHNQLMVEIQRPDYTGYAEIAANQELALAA